MNPLELIIERHIVSVDEKIDNTYLWFFAGSFLTVSSNSLTSSANLIGKKIELVGSCHLSAEL